MLFLGKFDYRMIALPVIYSSQTLTKSLLKGLGVEFVFTQSESQPQSPSNHKRSLHGEDISEQFVQIVDAFYKTIL